MKDKELSLSLTNSIDKNTIAELTADFSEVALDAALESGVLKDIPIFGSLVKAFDVKRSITDYLYTKKLYVFLQELSKVSESERKSFVKKLVQENEQLRVGEKLLFLIDELDEIEKSRLLAKAFAALIEEQLIRKEFDILAHGITRLNIEYIDELIQFYLHENSYIEPYAIDHLYVCGFISLAIENSAGREYRKCSAGKNFVEKVLKPTRIDILSSIIKVICYAKVQEQLDDPEKYKMRLMTFEEMSNFIEKLNYEQLLKLRVTGYQIFGEDRAWIIRRIADQKYQHIIELNNT